MPELDDDPTQLIRGSADLSGVAVLGLGYVGIVTAACLARRGHHVIGVDVDPDKVAMVRSGTSPVIEDHIGELVSAVVDGGRLEATTSAADAVSRSDVSMVCVGTPSNSAGGLSTEFLERVTDEIGAALAGSDRPHHVIYRSTMVPGTCDELLVPRLVAASGRPRSSLGVAVNPEFLREGTSVADFHDPPKTVIGSGDRATIELLTQIYADLPGPTFVVPTQVAELTKYVDNSFHALKVAFANEVGTLAKGLGIDSHDVMEIFKADKKLNVSAAYLTPGFAFGGSCLPKDVRALLHTARHNDIELPLWSSILPANEAILDRVHRAVLDSGAERVALFGLSFKAGTDDLRESPMVSLAERLLGGGRDIMIHDRLVAVANLRGANQAHAESRIPHLSRLMSTSADAVANHGDVIVLATRDPEAVAAVRRASATPVIDLVRVHDVEIERRAGYQGVAW